jgi:hypothetical protein
MTIQVRELSKRIFPIGTMNTLSSRAQRRIYAFRSNTEILPGLKAGQDDNGYKGAQ